MPRGALVTVLVVAGVVLAVGLFFLLRPGSEPVAGGSTAVTSTAPSVEEPATTEETTAEAAPTVPLTRLDVTVRDGKPVGGIRRTVAPEGGPVVVRVTSDVADEVHIHGYDRSADVAPGSPAVIRLDATIAGRFEIELEHAGTPIAELEVRP